MYAYHWLSDQPMQIRFEYRKSNAQKVEGQTEKNGTLYAALTINGRPAKPFATPIQCPRPVWDARRSVRPGAEVKALNAKIQDYQRRLELAHTAILLDAERLNQSVIVTAELIRQQLLPRQLITLPRIYADFSVAKRLLIEPDRRKRSPEQISESTYRSYPKRWVLIHSYLAHARLLEAPLEQITYATADKLKRYLLGVPQESGMR